MHLIVLHRQPSVILRMPREERPCQTRVLQRKKYKQNKLPQNTSSEQQWETWSREIAVSHFLILFCSHSGVLWFFCHPQSHSIPTLNHGPTCGYHRPSPNPVHNHGLNSQYTALKTFFSTTTTHGLFFFKWV